jgi:hypothetical protein
VVSTSGEWCRPSHPRRPDWLVTLGFFTLGIGQVFGVERFTRLKLLAVFIWYDSRSKVYSERR